MKAQQLQQEFARVLSSRLPNLYKEMKPFFSLEKNGKNAVVPQRGMLVQPIQHIIDSLNCSYICTNPEAFLDGLCDCVVGNYPQTIMSAYNMMNMDGQSTDIKDFDRNLHSLLCGIKSPLIVSCNVDLHTLRFSGSRCLQYNKGNWFFNNIHIYEMPPTAFPTALDSVLLILEKDDAPFLDNTQTYGLHLNSSTQTEDESQSMEVILMPMYNSKGIAEDYLIVFPLHPLWYNSQAMIHSLKINIDYDKLNFSPQI